MDALIAQLLLLLAGLLVCFRGYSTLKLAIALTAFLVVGHAVLSHADLLPKEPAWLPLALAAAAGLLAAGVLFVAYRLGVVLLGAGVSVALVLKAPQLLPPDETARWAVLGAVAVVGALLARFLERVLLSAVTAAYGGFMVASVVLAAAGQSAPGVVLPHSLDQIPRAPLFLVAWGSFTLAGTWVQLRRRGKA